MLRAAFLRSWFCFLFSLFSPRARSDLLNGFRASLPSRLRPGLPLYESDDLILLQSADDPLRILIIVEGDDIAVTSAVKRFLPALIVFTQDLR